MSSGAKITVRLDEALSAHIDILIGAGAKDGASAIREAVRSAAKQVRLRQAADDAERLATDPKDRAEVAIIRGLMGAGGAW